MEKDNTSKQGDKEASMPSATLSNYSLTVGNIGQYPNTNNHGNYLLSTLPDDCFHPDGFGLVHPYTDRMMETPAVPPLLDNYHPDQPAEIKFPEGSVGESPASYEGMVAELPSPVFCPHHVARRNENDVIINKTSGLLSNVYKNEELELPSTKDEEDGMGDNEPIFRNCTGKLITNRGHQKVSLTNRKNHIEKIQSSQGNGQNGFQWFAEKNKDLIATLNSSTGLLFFATYVEEGFTVPNEICNIPVFVFESQYNQGRSISLCVTRALKRCSSISDIYPEAVEVADEGYVNIDGYQLFRLRRGVKPDRLDSTGNKDLVEHIAEMTMNSYVKLKEKGGHEASLNQSFCQIRGINIKGDVVETISLNGGGELRFDEIPLFEVQLSRSKNTIGNRMGQIKKSAEKHANKMYGGEASNFTMKLMFLSDDSTVHVYQKQSVKEGGKKRKASEPGSATEKKAATKMKTASKMKAAKKKGGA